MQPLRTDRDGGAVLVEKFQRVLYSEYNADYGLKNYLNYKRLKNLIHSFQTLTPQQILLEHSEGFFNTITEELKATKAFYQQKEEELISGLREMQECSVADLIEKHDGVRWVTETYVNLHLLDRYRKLNFFGIKKALEKFLLRCAMRSLALQAQIDEKYNELIADLEECVRLDIGAGLEFLVNVFCQIHRPRLSFEESTERLERVVAADYRCRPRILDNTLSTFFRPNRVHRRDTKKYNLRVLTGSSNTRLAHNIELCLGKKNGKKASRKARVKLFANGEVDVQVNDNTLGDDIFVVQSIVSTRHSTCSTAMMELLLLSNSLVLEGVGRLTAVIPFMGYATSHHGPAIAQMLLDVGVEHLITVDLSVDQVEGYFGNVPVENVWAKKELVKYLHHSLTLEGTKLEDVVVVSCDSHSVARARAFADSLSRMSNVMVGVVTAFIPPPPGQPLLVGSVEGKHCVIVDNVIDEGQLVIEVTKLLQSSGAREIKAVATHGVFSGDCIDRLSSCGLQEVVVTDSLPSTTALLHPDMARIIRIVPIAPLLAEAIERVHLERPLSSVFEK
eukprot:PhM_4_TR6466/c0_g1_i1/m.3571/K00948/PRPS, prsA; ribose-phosphate pyrophosphokinase